MFNQKLRRDVKYLEEESIRNQMAHAQIRHDLQTLMQHLGLKFEDVPARHEIVVGPFKKK